MPLLAPFDLVLPRDGRQSHAALLIRRGVGRFLRARGLAVLPELTLPCGRRADLVGVDGEGAITIVEVKSCLADWRADGKWERYRRWCDAFYFATDPNVGDIFPGDEGLILTDGYDAHMERAARPHRLAAPVRRVVHLRMAQAAARRLHELEDPQDTALTAAL